LKRQDKGRKDEWWPTDRGEWIGSQGKGDDLNGGRREKGKEDDGKGGRRKTSVKDALLHKKEIMVGEVMDHPKFD